MDFQRVPISAGNASPAEMQRRRRDDPAPGMIYGLASRPAYKVGTPPNSVGLCVRIISSTASGVGRPGSKTDDAPTDIGNVRLFPSPYAWNALAAENITSSGRIPSTFAP